ncbi:outer membrane beta-barrel protein [Aquabacterium sp.]|uniref:outer membrane beta-barrel protein n=1 Tax=Aquabacterium sp. TaxID=1872578 RepID=UPI00248788CD|nr:outer membrane beta-barrel protein [Aquabacterium sp.]MDI1258834.1 outer membrane beta-barrel protein [Aquabacterium sp.]
MKTIISAALLVLANTSAFAVDIYGAFPTNSPEITHRGEQGFQLYGGATFGASHLATNCVVIGADSYTCEPNDTGFKVYSGFNITSDIAVELGYIGFGSATIKGTVSGIPFKGAQESNALVLNGAWRFDMTPKFSGVVRVGLASVDSKVSASANVPGAYASASDTKIAPYAGFGLEYALATKLRAVAALDVTTSDIQGDKSTVGLLSIGAQYGF